MKHFTHEELVDLVDGALPSSRAAHAGECEHCRDRVAELSATLARARDDGGYEPSPLFWDHFSARVAEAIGQEALPQPRRWTWVHHPAMAWGTSAAIAILLMVTALWRATLHAPLPVSTTRGTATPIVEPSAFELPDIEQDGAWALVRAAADDLPLEDVQAAGIAAHPGAAENLAFELTADERVELARLIETEMKNGAS